MLPKRNIGRAHSFERLKSEETPLEKKGASWLWEDDEAAKKAFEIRALSGSVLLSSRDGLLTRFNHCPLAKWLKKNPGI